MTCCHPFCRAVPRFACAAFLFALAGCMADDPGLRTGQVAGMGPAAPSRGRAAYDCGEDGIITLETGHAAVRLIEQGDGGSYELPASPPAQASRYGSDGMALVIEDGEALWMKAGSEPITCRR